MTLSHELEKKSMVASHQEETKNLESMLKELKSKTSALESDFETSRRENTELKSCIASQSASSLVLETQLNATKIQLDVNNRNLIVGHKDSINGQSCQN